jgi:hypothetical protein
MKIKDYQSFRNLTILASDILSLSYILWNPNYTIVSDFLIKNIQDNFSQFGVNLKFNKDKIIKDGINREQEELQDSEDK